MNPGGHILKKLKSCLYVCSGGFSLYSAVNIYQENEKFYEKFLLPLVHHLDPELAHNIAVKVCKYGLITESRFKDPPNLSIRVWHLVFQNPVGIAAGFDKHGEAIKGLHKIGFGFVEIGSVTPEPQEGNEKPRVFRLSENKAIINRYGFNSEGHDCVLERLRILRSDSNFKGIVGVNLGKNRDSVDPVNDYIKGIEKFGSVADYLVINISSPNTPGLRDYQKKEQLQVLLAKLVAARNSLNCHTKPPLLLKLAPDLSHEERKDIAQIVLSTKCQVDGLVICNTTTERNSDLKGSYVQESGGLSGQPLANVSTEFISEMYKLTEGKIPIIGIGGIFTGQDAYDKIQAGASLIQLYTSFVYHGPPRVMRIKQELNTLLQKDGFHNVAEAVGKNIPKK